MSSLEELIRLSEACKIMHVPIKTAQDCCRAGLITGAIRLENDHGREWMIPKFQLGRPLPENIDKVLTGGYNDNTY
jgi:hypothetical protein